MITRRDIFKYTLGATLIPALGTDKKYTITNLYNGRSDGTALSFCVREVIKSREVPKLDSRVWRDGRQYELNIINRLTRIGYQHEGDVVHEIICTWTQVADV